MTAGAWARPALYGMACALLLGVYAAILMLISGRDFLLMQVAQYW